MKVLILTHSYFPNKDGIALHCYNLVEALKNKIDINVLYPKSNLKIPGFSSLIIPDIKTIFEIFKRDYDIIHVHGYGNIVSLIGAIIGLIRGKKVVWTIHGIPDKHKFFILYHSLAKHILKRATVISVSKNIEKIHNKYYLIPNGIDLELFKCSSSYKQAKYVSYIGRLDRDKDIIRLIREYKGEILIVGKDEDNYLEELKKESKDNVKFIEVEYKDIVEIYCKSKYIVLPSKYEGFPLVMIESLACERPFIATPVGEIPNFLKNIFGDEYEKYIIDTTIDKVIDRLEKLDLTSELKKAREKLKNYSWENIAKMTLEVYKDALGR